MTLACPVAHAAGSASLDIVLGTPEGFIANRIAPLGGGRACIAGVLTDSDMGGETPYAVLVDTTQARVIWHRTIPVEQGRPSGEAIDCASDGNEVYVLTDEHTHTEASLDQARVIVNAMAADGAVRKRVEIDAGFDEWPWLIEARPEAVTVAGSTSGSSQHGGPFGVFVAHFGPRLSGPRLDLLPSGAFDFDTAARLDGTALRVAGSFDANSGPHRDKNAFPAALIEPGRRVYRWSTYAFSDEHRQAGFAIGADGVTTGVAVAAKAIDAAVIDRDAHVQAHASVARAFCKALAVAPADGVRIQAIGEACEGDTPLAVQVTIDAARGTVRSQPLGMRLDAVRIDGGAWLGVTHGKAHLLRRAL